VTDHVGTDKTTTTKKWNFYDFLPLALEDDDFSLSLSLSRFRR
jgi:hypothetical protein